MNIILGASGQIGSLIVKDLYNAGQFVKAGVRKKEAQENYIKSGIQADIVDLFDRKSLERFFKNGNTLFVLTPENPFSNNIFDDTQIVLENIKKAASNSSIRRIVGLSSLGAQHISGTGNLSLSYLLEHAFNELLIEKVFIRPAYYYSNWLGYLDTIQENGVLPTFFPADLKIPMIAPTDVASFITEIIINQKNRGNIIEIMGPNWYSTIDIARIFEKILQKEVEVSSIPEKEWKNTFLQFGITNNYADSLIEMTKAVIEGKAKPSNPDEVIFLNTDFEEYFIKMINKY